MSDNNSYIHASIKLKPEKMRNWLVLREGKKLNDKQSSVVMLTAKMQT